MNKVFPYLGIFCLLLLVSANTITTSIRDGAYACQTAVDDSDQTSVPAPVEEDVNEDDESSKFHPVNAFDTHNFNLQKQFFADHFLTSFHFLEIISPPPQA